MAKQVVPLHVGMLGWSAEAISKDESGYCYFPVGEIDETFLGGRKWVKLRLTASEDVRAEKDIIVADTISNVKEHTPVELSYERAAGGFQRVTEQFPLPEIPYYENAAGNAQKDTVAFPHPVTQAGIYDDSTTIEFTDEEVKYEIGFNANAADTAVPKFEARSVMFFADQDCLVRFNSPTRQQNPINAGAYMIFGRRITEIHVVRVTLNGTLQVWALG